MENLQTGGPWRHRALRLGYGAEERGNSLHLPPVIWNSLPTIGITPKFTSVQNRPSPQSFLGGEESGGSGLSLSNDLGRMKYNIWHSINPFPMV